MTGDALRRRDRRALAHLWLVDLLASRYVRYGSLDQDDLIGEGYIALLRAASAYDASIDVAAGGQHHATDVATALRCRANDFDFGQVGRKEPVGESRQAEHRDDRDADQDVASRPVRGLTAWRRRTVDAQALQVRVFGIKRHIASKAATTEGTEVHRGNP